MINTSQIIESYKEYLEIYYLSHYKKYVTLLAQNIESAKAEAIVYSLMKSIFHDVEILEDESFGGPDFLCGTNKEKFVIETTHLDTESVASQSGLDKKLSEGASVTSYSLITHKLREKISSKAKQLSNYPTPRVLAITCEHYHSDTFLGPFGAKMLFTSDTKITVPINKPIENTFLSSDLKDSIFFRFNNGVFESCRCSISAILLISLSDAYKSSIVGILHPDPVYRFSTDLLPSVPFLRIKKWPPFNHYIEMEWTIEMPKATEFCHRNINL